MRSRKTFAAVLVLFMMLFVANGLAIELSAAGKQKVSPLLKLQLGKSKSDLLAAASKKGLTRVIVRGGEPAFGVFIRSSATPKELESLGAEVKTWTPGICTAVVPLGAFPALVDSAKVTWIEPGVLTKPTLNVSCAGTPGGPPYLGANARPVYWRWKGAGVVVGVVDSGIDYTHGDFIADGTANSRILYLWDQNLSPSGGEISPSGFGYGVEYTHAQINNEIDGSPAGFVRSTDTEGHGTHVTGIAAGDGSDSDGSPPPGTYKGMAPEADIITVATTFYTNEVVDGVNYVFQQASALGEPAAVNLSLGDQIGPHDGTSAFETSLNALQGAGKVIVVSVGNDRGLDIHAEGHVSSPGNVTVTFSVPSTAVVPDVLIDLWYDGGDSYNVVVTAPNLATTAVCAPGNSIGQSIPGQGTVDIDNTVLSSPNNGDGNILIEVINPNNGTWQFTLTHVASGGDGDFDAWLTPMVTSGTGSPSFTSHATQRELVSEPATHSNIFGVGAHMTKISWTTSGGLTRGYGLLNLGELAPFSSPGPSRDTTSDPGHVKPDICAPGMGIASAMSKDATYDPDAIVDDSRHAIKQGTSMSAPHVTGAVALMLDKKGDFTPQELRTLMFGTTYTDSYTGAVPNNDYGYGKLNTEAFINSFTAAEMWSLYQ